jgi:hypothetical protein
LTAISEAPLASWLACRALSAFCFTVLVNWSIELAVSSRLAAWLSVRLDRSALPLAISRAAVLMASVASRIWLTISVSRSLVALVSFCSSPNRPS